MEKSPNSTDIKALINQVKSSVEKHDELAKQSGENFNIFSIMKMESDEVKTHSSIIAELLNPNGSHGLGSLPLEYFIDQLGIDFGEKKMNYASTKSIAEEYVGVINLDFTEGGRIDIVVRDSHGCVFLIENKIYAADQHNQLIRYENAYPEASIFYLTLDGKDAENTEKLTNQYHRISYKEDILEWLDKCLKASIHFPMLREVLNQYINLIKKLTGQTMNEKLKEEVSDNIKKNLVAASEIANNFNEVHRSMATNFVEELQVQLKVELNSEKNVSDDLWTTVTKKIHKTKVKEDYYLFQKKGWGNVYAYLRVKPSNNIVKGLTIDTENLNEIKEFKIKAEITDLKTYKSSDYSIIYTDDFIFNFSDPRETQKVYDSFEENIKEGVTHCTSFFLECEKAIGL